MTRNIWTSTSRLCIASLTVSMLGGCASLGPPANQAGATYQQAATGSAHETVPACAVMAPAAVGTALAVSSGDDRLSPGDRIQLSVAGDKDVLTGVYTLTPDGRLRIGDVVVVPAAGRTLADLQAGVRAALVGEGLVRNVVNNVRVALIEAAGVSVSVEGAVFDAGVVRAGERSAEARATTVGNPASGDTNAGRTLSVALRSAGGIRPDAAIDRVTLIRDGQSITINMAGAIRGGPLTDPQVQAGDRIVVPSAGCFQKDLVKPSAVTAPGVRVYMSNLSRPAVNNAGSAIGKDATSLPYGTRLLQGLVAANCVGGSMLNAGRQAVLMSRNPITGQSIVVARKVEMLVRDADRDDINPYLMPNDAIACYDSKAMALVDALGLMGNVAAQGLVARSLVQ